MNKNILVITPAFSGGSWICIARIVEFLKKNYSIKVVGLGKVIQKIPGVDFLSIPYPRYDRWGFVVKISPYVSFIWNLPLLVVSIIYILIKRENLILVNGFTTGLLVAPIAWIFKTKTIVVFNGYIEGYLSSPLSFIIKKFSNFIILAIANSEGAKKEVSLVIPKRKIVISEHFAEDFFFKSQIPRKNKGNLRILYVGRIDGEKLCSSLIDLAKEFQNSNLFTFIFAGIGDLDYKVKDLQKTSNNVKYMGYVSNRKKLHTLYKDADVLWSYGDETYLALPAVEALASATPIMIAKLSVVPSNTKKNVLVDRKLVPGNIGWIIDTNNISEIRRLIINISKTGISDKMRIDCRKHAEDKYSSLNLFKTLSEIENIIKSK